MKDNPKTDFVTKSECKQITSSFQEDLTTVKKALIGDDMRGGMVKDIADIKGKMNKINNNSGNNGLGKKERAMIYTAVITSGGVIAVELIKAATQIA